MGVTGLWPLVASAGKPTALETLESQILAVDVSIWLNQAVKGFRDASGNAVPHAHVLGLFHRLCKLLFYGIKPIFVFDGPPPQLKRDTLYRRRQRASAAVKKSQSSRAKILNNYVRREAVARQLERQTHQVEKVLAGGKEGLSNMLNKRSKELEKDLFELPDLKKEEDDDAFSSDSDREDILAALDIDNRTDIHNVDVEGGKFKVLPRNKQYEVLLELRERRKQNNWAKIHEMPTEANDFSGFQMQRLMKRRTIQKKMDDVGDALTAENETLADAKLFVGDRAGLKKQKMENSKKRISGKDFLYVDFSENEAPREPKRPKLEAEDGDEEDVDDPGEGSSQSDHRALVEESKEELSQEELLAMIKVESEVNKATNSFEEELFKGTSSMVLLPDAVSVGSSRQGGIRQSVEIDDEEPIAGSSKSIREMLEKNTQNYSCSSSKVKEDLKQSGVVITLNFDNTAKDNNQEDDIFADIFAAPEKKPSEDVEMMESSFSDDSSSGEEGNRQSSRPKQSEALNKAPPPKPEEDMFSDVFKVGEKNNSTEDVIKDLTSTMKKSDHLFLKITSKYMENENVVANLEAAEKAKKKTEPKASTSKDRSGKSVAENDGDILEKENQSLLEEMAAKQREERLLRFQKMSDDLAKTTEQQQDDDRSSDDEEEDLLISRLNAKAIDADRYNQEVVLGGLAKDKKELEEKPDAVYGASAPGFVRSKKLSNVVEVEDDLGHGGVELAPATVEKLQSLETTEENLLSEQELVEIQERLAKENNVLIAERGRQDRMAASLSDQMYSDCQELLQLFGVPWIVAPSEAEAQCAFLDMNGFSNGTITDDSDIWVFGGQKVYKNFFNQDKQCEKFHAEDISKAYGLSREKAILLAMLTGSDYTDGIENVGPVTALEILAEFPGVGMEPLKTLRTWWDMHEGNHSLPPGSKVRENLRRLVLPKTFPSDNVFHAYMNPAVDNSSELFSWAVPNFVEISDFAQGKFGWTRQKVEEMIKPVIRAFDKKAIQKRIDSYFTRDNIGIKATQKPSKRVEAAISKALKKPTAVLSSQPEKKTKAKQTKKKPTTEAAKKPTEKEGVNFVAPALSNKELEMQKQMEAKKEALRVLRMKEDSSRKRRIAKRNARVEKKRIVVEDHKLSESDSD